MTGFSRGIGGRLVLRLGEGERGLLIHFLEQLEELVAPPESDPDADPFFAMIGIDPDLEPLEDPVLQRLFPPAYIDDDEAAHDYRRYTERSLREEKHTRARSVIDSLKSSGDKVTVPPSMVDSWLGSLNDVRLAIATRLELTEENHDELAELPMDDPRGELMAVYGWLTYLQESLVQTLL